MFHMQKSINSLKFEPGISNPGWSLRSPAHTSAQYTVSTSDTWYPAEFRAGIGRGGGLGRFLPQPVKCPAEQTILCMVAHTALTGRESNAGNGKEIGWGPRDIIIMQQLHHLYCSKAN